jgi:hypothetical protein
MLLLSIPFHFSVFSTVALQEFTFHVPRGVVKV